MKTLPLVSIVLPTYNRAKYLPDAIESVLSQTYDNFELLIIDDASKDETQQTLSKYSKKDPRIIVIQNTVNIGLVKSLNKGIFSSSGSYIARLDDDDRWIDKEKLKKQVDFFQSNSDYVLVGGGVLRVDNLGNEITRFLLPKSDKDIRKAMLLNNPFVHVAVMFRKEAWNIVKGYDETLGFSEDWDLWMKFGKLGKMYNLPTYFVSYIDDIQNSSRKNVRSHAILNIKLRFKYRSKFPNFFKGLIIGFAALMPFQNFLRQFYRPIHITQKTRKTVKICQITTVDLSLRFLLLGFMKYLIASGFDVYGIASNGKWMKEIERERIHIRTIEMKRELFTPFDDFVALWHLVLFFRREKFDIIHTHTPKASFLGQIAAFLAGVPIRIHTVHGLFFQDDSSWRRKGFFMFIEKIIAHLAHLVFFVNREDVHTVTRQIGYPKGKVQYLGGGIDVNRFNPKKFSEQSVMDKKKELGVPLSAPVVGIVARLVAEKGYFDLFEAFRKVLEKFPNAILLVVGPSEPNKRDRFSEDIVKKYGIEDNTIFLGERIDIEECYSVMDIFVLPSYREGLGLSILEASAMEKPVVTTNIRGCREAVDDGKTGILVPVKDSSKLGEVIVYFLSHPQKAKMMGRAGRKKVETEFNEKMMFDTIIKEYEKLIQMKLK